MRVGGLPWIGERDRELPPAALVSRNLCDRHNSALQTLDEIAVRLFTAFDESNAVGSGKELLYLFNGHDIERWMLKVLCGLASSGNLPTDKACVTFVPNRWQEVLFGIAPFEDLHGLYICKDVGHLFGGHYGVALRAISRNNSISGIGLYICGYEFILSMSGFPQRRFDGRSFVYRPSEIHAKGHKYEKSVLFTWKGLADKGTIHTTLKRGLNE